MADDLFYHVSDEEDGEDALLDERLTGGSNWEAAPPVVPSF